VIDERLNTHRGQIHARAFSVDVNPKPNDCLLRRRFVRELFKRSEHQIAPRSAAIGLDFVPTVLPCLPASGALHKLEAALLKS
jgi:hypothetical protein